MTPPDHRPHLIALFLAGVAIGACLLRSAAIAIAAAAAALAILILLAAQLVRTLIREKRP